MDRYRKMPFDERLAFAQGHQCDKYDYLIAAFSGLSAGIIDVFFVGVPGAGLLGKSVDHVADEFVKKAARWFWENDKRESKGKKIPETLQQSISYLERAFPVNYDARYAKDLKAADGMLTGMSPKNHHLLSLSHAPDIIGLIFSIIDQFSPMASFVDHGQVIRLIPAKTNGAIPYMQGTNLPSKLFCGFVNWLGHLISDIAGSSSTRQAGKTGRGAGIPIPFYELLLFCDYGNFDGKTFAEISVKVFEQGYDLRHGAAMAIPVLLNDCMVRMLWAIKQKFYHKKEWKECVPTNRHSDLRVMLIVSNGALCMIDGVDALIRSNGNILKFLLRLNLIAWFRLILLILKEIMIRYQFTYADLKIQIQAVNAQLDLLCESLKSINYAMYDKEMQEVQSLNQLLLDDMAGTEKLYAYLNNSGIKMQFGCFEEFDLKMQDNQFVLEI